MCYQCHAGLSEENIKLSLQEALEKKNYDQWNQTSINHLILTILTGSDECRELARELLENYNKYKQLK
jgi:hypothetical protein